MKRCLGCMMEYDDSLHSCPHCGYEEGKRAPEAFQLQPGVVLNGHYLLGRVLGFGGFGTTYIAWDETMSRVVAIKEYLPTIFATRGTEKTKVTVYAGAKGEQFEKGRKQFLEEARKLAKFTGAEFEPIVAVYDFFEENGTAYIVMEYLDGETLKEILKREGTMSFDAALRIVEPILKALQGVHREGIIHRDIAPDNIKITKDGRVKLLDFGAAREASVNHSHSLSVIYKQGYAPEEQFQSRGEQGAWTDVYALAATLYHLVTGEKPAPSLERLVKDTLVPPSAKGVKITPNQENALLNALNVRHEKRTQSAEAFLKELKSNVVVQRIVENEAPTKKAKKAGKKGGGGKVAVILLLLLVVIGGGAFVLGNVLGLFGGKDDTPAIVQEEKVQVPSFVNCTWDEAVERAREAGLRVETSGIEYSADIEKDLVLSQDIKGGSMVAKNSTIKVVLSGGVEHITMREVSGKTAEEAKKLLEEAGFKVRIEEIFSDQEVGTVVSTNLSAGSSYVIGTEVVATVSKGQEVKVEEKYTLELYVGHKIEDVQAVLAESGLKVKVQEEFSAEVEAGIVMAQSKKEGTECKKGTTLTLTVSKGKEMVAVPVCASRSFAEVEQELTALGFAVTSKEAYSDKVNKGYVISISVEEETQLEKGSAIEVTVSKGKKTTATKTPTPKPTKKPTATPIPTPKPLAYINIHKAKVGSYVTFGTYEQDGNSSNGKEKIEWEVKAVESDRVLLVSRYCLDNVAYNATADGVSWSTSSLRTWLNDTFCKTAFTSTEQGNILWTSIETANNDKYGTHGGGTTTDKVFLLSYEEANSYYSSMAKRVVEATKYAIKQGVSVNEDNECEWWLRTPGENSKMAMIVQKQGSVALRGYSVQLEIVGVRPAIWVRK